MQAKHSKRDNSDMQERSKPGTKMTHYGKVVHKFKTLRH